MKREEYIYTAATLAQVPTLSVYIFDNEVEHSPERHTLRLKCSGNTGPKLAALNPRIMHGSSGGVGEHLHLLALFKLFKAARKAQGSAHE